MIRNISGTSTERTAKLRGWTSISFNSANIKYTLHTQYWLPNHKSDGNAHYSLEDSATEPFLPHWRSDKNKQSNAQWHAQQWQQDSVTNYSKRQKWDEIWNQWGTKLVNSSFEHDYCHHQKPVPLAPNFDLQLRLWTTSETSDWSPQLAILGVWPSISTPVDTSFFPDSRSKIGMTCKNEDNKPLPQKQIHNVN